MSYISFYRKWRPQAFSEVIGQEHIVKTLQNAISKNMLVHGYMFCGTKGTGKTSIARIFAKAINCAHGPSIEPCNKCDNCISITSGSNVDLIEIDGASNNSVDDIRILREKVSSLPFILRKKIYIIDEVHMLSKSAFNALLKTLEEPPEHVIFIMATTEPDKVIPTIMSRCQRFDFKPISVDKIKNRLKDIASAEKIDITDSAASMIAKYSGGSIRDADGILEQLASFGDKDKAITVDEVSLILGLIDLEMLFELANIILEKNINQGLLFVSRLFSTSFSINTFVSGFLEHLYSLYVIKNYENPADILDMPDDFKENYYNQAGLFTSLQLENLIDLFTSLLAQIKDSENPKTFFKAAVIKALNTEAIKSGHVIQIGQVTKSDQVIKTDQVIKNGQATKNLKITDLDIRQSNNEPSVVNSGSKIKAEAPVLKNSSTETVAAAGFVSTTDIPGQQKMAEAANASDWKAKEETSAKGVAKETTEAVIGMKPDEASFEKRVTIDDSAVAPGKGTIEKADVKVTVKETAEKKETAKSNKEQSLKDVPFPDKSITVVENRSAKKPGIEPAEDLPQHLKKSTDDLSNLILEIWLNLLIKTKETKVFLEAKLKEVKRFRLLGNKLFFLLEPKNNWHKAELNKTENRVMIQELLKSLTGEKFEITFDFISDENISESIDLLHSARKIRASGDLHQENKETLDFSNMSTNADNPGIDTGVNAAAPSKSRDGKETSAGSDTYGYFEKKFKVKEK